MKNFILKRVLPFIGGILGLQLLALSAQIITGWVLIRETDLLPLQKGILVFCITFTEVIIATSLYDFGKKDLFGIEYFREKAQNINTGNEPKKISLIAQVIFGYNPKHKIIGVVWKTIQILLVVLILGPAFGTLIFNPNPPFSFIGVVQSNSSRILGIVFSAILVPWRILNIEIYIKVYRHIELFLQHHL